MERRDQFGGADVPVLREQWQTLSFRFLGNQFQAALDGKTLFAATDRTFTEAGKIGLWAKSGSLTYFDWLVWETA